MKEPCIALLNKQALKYGFYPQSDEVMHHTVNERCGKNLPRDRIVNYKRVGVPWLVCASAYALPQPHKLSLVRHRELGVGIGAALV